MSAEILGPFLELFGEFVLQAALSAPADSIPSEDPRSPKEATQKATERLRVSEMALELQSLEVKRSVLIACAEGCLKESPGVIADWLEKARNEAGAELDDDPDLSRGSHFGSLKRRAEVKISALQRFNRSLIKHIMDYRGIGLAELTKEMLSAEQKRIRKFCGNCGRPLLLTHGKCAFGCKIR